MFSPQVQQSYTLDPHRKVGSVKKWQWFIFSCLFIVVSVTGAFDERSDGPFWSSSGEPDPHGPPPFQRTAYWLPNAQSLPPAPAPPTHPAGHCAAGGEESSTTFTHPLVSCVSQHVTEVRGFWCVSDPCESGEESRAGVQYIWRSRRPRKPLLSRWQCKYQIKLNQRCHVEIMLCFYQYL